TVRWNNRICLPGCCARQGCILCQWGAQERIAMTKRIPRTAGVNTRLAHGGNDPHDYHGFVNPPVVHASTVLFPNAETLLNGSQKYTYGTRGTPTTDALAAAIDELEG